MNAKYSIYESPDPEKGNNKKYHARVVTRSIIKTDYLINEITDMSTLTSADVRGTLEALSSLMEKHLGRGNSVELEGIGTFSVSVGCPKGIEDPKKIKPKKVHFKKVVYKSNIRLKKGLQSMSFQHEKENSPIKLPKEKRLQNILDYLKENTIIYSAECMKINSCTRYQALEDLTELRNENKITRQGKRATCIYLLK